MEEKKFLEILIRGAIPFASVESINAILIQLKLCTNVILRTFKNKNGSPLDKYLKALMLKASKHLLLMKLMLIRKIKLRSIYHPSNVNKTKCFMFNISKKLWMRTQTFVMKDRSLLELPFKNCQKVQEKLFVATEGQKLTFKTVIQGFS